MTESTGGCELNKRPRKKLNFSSPKIESFGTRFTEDVELCAGIANIKKAATVL